MMKSYLRYEPEKVFGVITSPTCGVAFDSSGNLVISGGVHEVNLWNVRQGTQTAQLKDRQDPAYPFCTVSEVTALAPSPDKKTIAVGYSTGEVRIFDFIQQTLLATFRGHRSAVLTLVYDTLDDKGLILASGGADCDIFLWDVVANVGLARLRGHKDAITGIGFLKSRSNQSLLVSASKDTLLKIWDVDTRHCIQTVLGHRSEIWCLAVLKPLEGEDPCAFRVLTGCGDDKIRGYRVRLSTRDHTNSNDDVLLDDEELVLEYYGDVVRSAARSDNDKCTHLAVGPSVIAAQSGKSLEVFRVRGPTETKRRLKKRLKKMKTNSGSEAHGAGAGDAWGGVAGVGSSSSPSMEEAVAAEEDGDGDGDDDDDDDVLTESDAATSPVVLSDELEYLSTIRAGAKLKGCCFRPVAHGHKGKLVVLLSLVTNSFEMYDVVTSRVDSDVGATPTKSMVLDMPGHRSDVRAVTVSEDGNTIASCSSEGVKVWSATTFTCIRSCNSGFGVTLAFAPGSRYLVVGTKEGAVQIIDTASGEIVLCEEGVHTGPVWAVAVRPDGKGFVSGGADKFVRMWEFEMASTASTTISAAIVRQLQMTKDVLSLRYNYATKADKLLLCVGLLDSTVKIFFEDSLKFFLSLYGHKLPVMSMDISDDTRLLASGSADKTIKIWGLDFGDCHRSLSGHTDSVTSIRFQPHTHYFFSASKDGSVKYWDADRFEQILTLPGHKGPVWCLDVPKDASYCVSVGQDRSLRVWRRGDDLVFVEEEKERALEALADRVVGDDGFGKNKPQRNDDQDKDVVVYEDAMAAATTVGTRSLDSVRGGESIMEALDVVDAELSDIAEYAAIQKKSKSKLKARPANPVLLGMQPHSYMMAQLKRVKQPDLEQALLVLPFDYVVRLIRMLIKLSELGHDLELCCRASIFLLRCHFSQITASRVLVNEILCLRKLIRHSVGGFRDLIGVNLAALRHVKRAVESDKEDYAVVPELVPDAKRRK